MDEKSVLSPKPEAASLCREILCAIPSGYSNEEVLAMVEQVIIELAVEEANERGIN